MKDKENFYVVFNDLDQSQKDAVKSKDNYIFVSGGSGTGKTRVVCCHAAYLMLEHGYKSDEILIFSGISNSEEEIERNIYKLVRKNYSEKYINSFISFCLKILKKNWNLIEGMYPNFRILNNFKRNTIIDEIVKNTRPKEYKWKFKDIKREISEFIRFLKQNRISVQEFENVINADKFDGRFLDTKNIYKTYSEILKKYEYLDFEDVILKTIEFFEDTEKSKSYINRFKKIIVDNFLDINPLQYRLIRVLADKIDKIFITGNEKQALFGFRGEHTKNVMEKFLKDFPNTKIIYLETNYRSDNQILDAVDKIFDFGTHDFMKIPRSIYNCPKNLFTVAVERSIIDEAFYIGKKIKKIISSETKSISYDSDTNEGFTYSDFAILLRNVNEYGSLYKQILDYLKIPNQTEDSLNISCFKELNYLLVYLRLLDNQYDDKVFKKLLSNSFSGFSPIELMSLLDASKREKKGIYDVMKIIDSVIINFENENKKLIDKVKVFINRFDLLQRFSQKLSLPEFISKVIYGIFPCDLFEDNKYPILKRFINITIDYYEVSSAMKWEPSLKSFLNFFEENKQYLFENLEVGDEQSDTVKITSIYRSRGKEFSVVFVPLLTENNFPAGFSGERFFYVKDIDDFQKRFKRLKNIELYFTNAVDFNKHITREKNLFLTALTRARERVFLSFPSNIPAVEEVRPSIFLKNIFGGREITRENCEKIKLNGHSVIYEENGYSDFFEKVTKLEVYDQEVNAHITSKEELEIVLKRFIKYGLDKEKFSNMLDKHKLGYVDKTYLLLENPCLPEAPVNRNIGADFIYSHTSIKSYLECPRKFYYSRILDIIGAKSIHLTIGSIEHEIVRNLHNQKKYPQIDEILFKEILNDVWERYKGEFENEFYEIIWKKYVNGRILDYMNKYGKYCKDVYETEKDFKFFLNNRYIISGKIDRIDKREDGFEIIDYKKSGEGKENKLINLFYKYDKDFQMPVYYYAAKDSLGINPSIFSYIFFDFDKRRSCEKVEIPIMNLNVKGRIKHVNPEIMEHVKSRLVSILDDISKERSNFDRVEDTECKPYRGYKCEYLNICNQSQS